MIPSVDADGNVQRADLTGAGGGALLLQRHGGTDTLYGRRSDDLLAACDAQPPRLLLGHALQTQADKKKGAQANAVLYALLALLPTMLAAGLLGQVSGSKGFGLVCWVAMMVAAMGQGFWKEISAPGKVWELTEWIDFEARVWRARKTHADGSLPTFSATVPLDELALVCFMQQWEQGDTYDTGLCKRTALRPVEMDRPACLNQLHSSDDEAGSHAFARALAARWGIECWQHVGGFTPTLQRLAPQDPRPVA